MNNQEMKECLRKYNQHHIIEHMEKLTQKEKLELVEQINEIDFEEITRLYNKTITERKKREMKIEPLKAVVPDKITDEEKKEYINLGEKALKENKYAVVTMAGGQGTRLRT